MGKLGTISRVIFVKSRDNAVAILGHPSVELSFRAVKPIGNPNVVVLPPAHLAAEVEIAVAKRAAVQSGLDPVAIHSESAEKNAPVVATQKTVVGIDALGAQREKYGIDELHDIIAFETTKGAPQPPEEGHCGAPVHAVAFQIDVARIAFPAIAIGGQCDFVSERAERRGECGVDVGVIAEE